MEHVMSVNDLEYTFIQFLLLGINSSIPINSYDFLRNVSQRYWPVGSHEALGP